jgi:hypothetical protein
MGAPSLGLTSYSEQKAGYPGMIADMSEGTRVISRRNSDTASLAFGTAVIRDTDALTPSSPIGNVKYPTATGFRCDGLVVHAHNYEQFNGSLDATGVKTDGIVGVMKRGMMYVNTEDAATEGLAAFVRHTANGAGKTPGNLRSDADTNKADEVVGIIWRTTTVTAGDLCLVEVDMPAYDADKNV